MALTPSTKLGTTTAPALSHTANGALHDNAIGRAEDRLAHLSSGANKVICLKNGQEVRQPDKVCHIRSSMRQVSPLVTNDGCAFEPRQGSDTNLRTVRTNSRSRVQQHQLSTSIRAKQPSSTYPFYCTVPPEARQAYIFPSLWSGSLISTGLAGL